MTKRLFRFARALTIGAALLAPLATVAPLLPGPVHAQGGPADLADVARAIRGITTLKASFQQVSANGQVQDGTLLLKQPGHIRFDYKGGDLLVVADGKSLYVIDYQVAQVERWPIRNSPLGALLDPGRDLTRYGRLVPTGDARFASVEVRDPAHPEYGTLTLVFSRNDGAPGGLELTGWIARDAQGNRTTIRLGGISYGAAIAEAAFKWVDPRRNLHGPR
jgi:outer membrane lipoprotein-sorting protein